jgi:hypothetical protein
MGNRQHVLAQIDAIVDGDTWATGLGKVEAVFATGGDATCIIGATYSGGIVTFAITAQGTAANVKLLAIGLA